MSALSERILSARGTHGIARPLAFAERCRHTGDAYLCVFAQLRVWMCFPVLLAFELYKTGVTVQKKTEV